MPITRLNHAVLFVANLERSVSFYQQALGFTMISAMAELPGAAFLRAPGSSNDHDLGLFELGPAAEPSPAGRTSVGLYHLAWEVDTLAELQRVRESLAAHGALGGATDHGTTKSVYGRDPDALEFEIVWIIPADLLDETALAGRTTLAPLNLDKEIQRYGPETRGGVGISVDVVPPGAS